MPPQSKHPDRHRGRGVVARIGNSLWEQRVSQERADRELARLIRKPEVHDIAVLHGVDHASSARRARAALVGPGAGFLRADGEVGDEAQEVITRRDQAVEARLLKAKVSEIDGAFVRFELGDLRLELGRDDDDFGAYRAEAVEEAQRVLAAMERPAGGRQSAVYSLSSFSS